MNRQGDRLYPGTLPATDPEGRRYPSPLLSPTFTLTHEAVPPRPIDAVLPSADRIDRDLIVIDGEGWGHGVGMSQWGARIMAADGASHQEILEHYYAGTEVVAAPELVPDEVVVGLDWGLRSVRIDVDGPTTLRVNGVPVSSLPNGSWALRATTRGVALIAVDAEGPAPDLDSRPWPQ